MKYLILILLTTAISWYATATNIVWDGPAVGDWEVASNWSTNTVPTINDNVIIFNTTVTLSHHSAYAKGVYVYAEAMLKVEHGANLYVKNNAETNAVYVAGELQVYGRLKVEDGTSENGIRVTGQGNILNSSTGLIQVENISGKGITNSGHFFNHGSLHIRGCSLYGIENEGQLFNSGNIYTLFINDTGIINTGSIINEHNLNARYCDIGIWLQEGTLENNQQGFLSVDHIGTTGIKVSPESEVYNEGEVNGYGALQIMIDNYGYWENFNGSSTAIYDGIIGLYNRNNAEFHNDGVMGIHSGVTQYSIQNQAGSIINGDCGELTIHRPIYSYGFAYIENRHVLINESPMIHFITGVFENTGVIHDSPGHFANNTYVNNYGMIITKALGTVYLQEPFPSPVLVADEDIYADFDSYKWFDSPQLDKVAGYYNGNDEWVVTPYAEGLDELFTPVSTPGGCEVILSIDFENPIQAQPLHSPVPYASENIESENVISGFRVYPNPFQQSLNLHLSADLTGEHSLNLFDVTGRLVHQQSIPVERGTIALGNLSGLTSGTYMLTLSKGGQLVWQERVVKF